jgi:Telomerase ribonucleoprotein complex - RNA binding domain
VACILHIAYLTSVIVHALAVKNFISYRRYETMSLHSIMQGLSTTGCKWTAYGITSTAHTPASSSIKRRELLEEFIIWYFGSFVTPLLRASGSILSWFSSLKSTHRLHST